MHRFENEQITSEKRLEMRRWSRQISGIICI